jgi:hypothetical protein
VRLRRADPARPGYRRRRQGRRATLRRDHVAVSGDSMTFRYLAEGGLERRLTVVDRYAAPVVRALLTDATAASGCWGRWAIHRR